jgi:N-acetylmuramoyl-L-alanine amidase
VLIAVSVFNLVNTLNHKTTKEVKYINNVTVKPVYIYVVKEEPKPEPAPQPVEPSEDEKLLARIINAEAGNQPYDGKLAVGNVIMNRVKSPQFPNSIKDVVYQSGQFSSVSNGAINKEPNAESIQAAKEIINGRKILDDNVLFFYEPNIATDSWIRTRKVVTKIGQHVFAL